MFRTGGDWDAIIMGKIFTSLLLFIGLQIPALAMPILFPGIFGHGYRFFVLS